MAEVILEEEAAVAAPMWVVEEAVGPIWAAEGAVGPM